MNYTLEDGPSTQDNSSSKTKQSMKILLAKTTSCSNFRNYEYERPKPWKVSVNEKMQKYSVTDGTFCLLCWDLMLRPRGNAPHK